TLEEWTKSGDPEKWLLEFGYNSPERASLKYICLERADGLIAFGKKPELTVDRIQRDHLVGIVRVKNECCSLFSYDLFLNRSGPQYRKDVKGIVRQAKLL